MKCNKIYKASKIGFLLGFFIGVLPVLNVQLQAQEQVRKYAIIDKVKRDTYNFLETTKAGKKQKKDKSFYTVYSDRSDNKVYFSSNAQIAGDKQDFLASYYVIDQKDDYLEVVSHDPSLIGKPKGIFSFLFKGKYTFSDAKKMKYIGWVHKDNVIRYSHPKLSTYNYKPIRYVVGIQNTKTLYNIGDYVKKQNVFLYEDPMFVNKSTKKLSLDQLVYLYKYDTDRKAALVSNLDHMKPADSVARVMGWIPRALLKKVGQQRIFTVDKADSLAFFGKTNKRVEYVDKKDIESNILYDLSEHQKRPVTLKDSIDVVLPLAVWDHSDNKLINVDGDKISIDKLSIINKEHKIINFHYIFDCSNDLKKKHLKLMSSLQQIWVLLSTDEKYSDYEFSFSASSYGCSKFYTFPKSASFSSWIDFLHNIFIDNEYVATKNYTQGIEKSFENVIADIPQHSFANNIILIAGEKFFFNLPNIKSITTKLGQRSSRLIFYQLENKANDQHQDFILQSKDILSRVSKHHADFIRAFIVDNALIKNENVFTNISAIDNVYVYDAPKNSTYQGGVVFPKINNKLRASSLDIAIDSVLTTSIKFNSKLFNSLVHNANKLGFLRSKPAEKIKEIIQKDNIYIENNLQMVPRNFMREKYYQIKNYTLQNNPKTSTAYLLSKEELITVVNEYKSLIPSFRRIAKRRDRKKMYGEYRKNSRGINKKLFRKTLRKRDHVADLVFMKTGLPVQSEFLQQTKIKDVYKKRKTSHLDFTLIIKKLREKTDVLEKTLSDKEAKVYKDGGNIEFHLIPEAHVL